MASRAQQLARKALEAKQARQEHNAVEKQSRMNKQKLHLELLLACMKTVLTSQDISDQIDAAAEKGHDSTCVWEIFLPTFATVEGQRALVVPQTQTYFAASQEAVEEYGEEALALFEAFMAEKGVKHEDLNEDAVPLATYWQGPVNKASRRSEPAKLPGGKTLIDLLNAWIVESTASNPDFPLGGMVVVQEARSKTLRTEIGTHRSTVLRMVLVWDVQAYRTRRQETAQKRQNAARTRRDGKGRATGKTAEVRKDAISAKDYFAAQEQKN